MAAGNETLSTLEKVLKRRFDKRCEVVKQEEDKIMASIRRETMWGGFDGRISIVYGDPQGGSASLSTAISNKTSSLSDGFVLTRKSDFHVCSLDSEAMYASEGQENSVINALDNAQDGGLRNMLAAEETQFYGDGRGTRGNINATVTGTTVTLLEPADIVNFFNGMKIEFADPAGAAGAVRSGGALTVSAIDEKAGTFTVSANLNTTGVVSGDDIVRAGDRDAVMQGLGGTGTGGWLPFTRSSLGTAFFGVTRSADPIKLAGWFLDGGGANRLETISRLNTYISRSDPASQKKRVCVVNIEDHQEIALSLGSNVVIDSKTNNVDWGADTITLRTPRGPLPIVGSIRQKKGYFKILRPDTWVIKTLKADPHMVDDDGLTLRVGATTDDVTWRLRAYRQLGCYAPGYNGTGKF